MQFLHPGFLYLALLGVIPVLLYFFRRKSKTVQVSTLVFFKSLAREHQESAWLRRMKKLLSLLLTLVILLGVVGALSRLILAPRAENLRNVVILVDRSASMGAIDDRALTRLDEARKEIRVRLAGLPDDVGVSLIAYDTRAELLLPRSFKRRQLLSALGGLETRPVAGKFDAALSMARMIAELERPAEIWHYTDRVVARARDTEGAGAAEPETSAVAPAEEPGAGILRVEESLADDVLLRNVSLGLEDPVNIGITAFRLRKVPLVHATYEAYIQVSAAAGMRAPAEVQLEVRLGDVPVQIRKLELEGGDREGLILPVEGAAGQLLRIQLTTEGDCFAVDDELIALLPESRPVVAAWMTGEGDPFTELALSSIANEGELEFWKGSPESWPLEEEVDLVIFDGWLPPEWPRDLPAIVLNPPGSLGPVRAVPLEQGGIPHDFVRVSNEQHPLLFRVSSGRLAVTQTAVIDASGSLQPLWFAGNEPVLIAGEVRGQRLVIMGFSPEHSERLPLSASYPLLMGNAVFWCAEPQLAAAGGDHRKTGEVIELPEGVEALQWREVRNGKLVDNLVSAKGALVELDRVGLWSAGEKMQGSALLLARAETDLGGVLPDGTEAGGDSETVKTKGAGFLKGEITWLLLWLVLLFLIVESWLFHRHAVY